MKRWWSYFTLPAMALGLGLPAQTSASTHCTVSIIMTTLGTDGTTSTQTIPVPPGSTLQLQTGVGTSPNINVPGAGSTSDPANTGSGSGSSSGSSGSAGKPLSSTPPSGATGNSVSEPLVDDATVVFPVPSNGDDTGEPTPPSPPILLPNLPGDPQVDPNVDVPQVDDTAIPTTNPNVAEAPEPGTLTLLGLATIGGLGYVRKKRKTA